MYCEPKFTKIMDFKERNPRREISNIFACIIIIFLWNEVCNFDIQCNQSLFYVIQYGRSSMESNNVGMIHNDKLGTVFDIP